ncbi:MAG: TPM domain-containing protein, partial [Pseudomonadota bacterium]|nr:TPM domain-containing protein [Pseudomonadota bacterium]
LPFLSLTEWSAPVIYLLQIMTFLIATIALSNEKIRFHIVPRRTKHDRAHAEALRQFFAQGIDKTEHRTGVLIFASAAERYVEVVADAGINDKVATSVWDDAVKALVTAIKAGRPGDGFVAAIEQCGAVLAAHFPPGALKRDELPDKLLEI